MRENVHLRSLAYTERTSTVYSFVDSTGSFARVVDLGPLPVDYDAILWEPELGSAKVFYVDGFGCLEIPKQPLLEIIQEASKHGLSVVFDPQTAISKIDLTLLKNVLKHTNILCLNQDEINILNSQLGLIARPTDLLALGPQKVFVKRGEIGCDLIYESQISHFPAVKTDVMNTQGAGDSFNAAVLAGEVWGFTALDTAILANVVASFKGANIQVSLGFPRIDDVIRRLLDAGHSGIAAEVTRRFQQ